MERFRDCIGGYSWIPYAALLPGERVLHGDAMAQQGSERASAAPGKAAAVANRGFHTLSDDIDDDGHDGIRVWW